MDALDELEHRVGEKWATVAATRTPQWELPDNPFDFSEWMTIDPGLIRVPQFPRERWASYPAKRTLALMVCDTLLDRVDELTDEQWMMVCLAMQYGGKTRIS